MADPEISREEKQIVVRRNGPYAVFGEIPLVRKVQVVSEYGEPLTWKKTETLPIHKTYLLCRCGKSKTMPFCDLTHTRIPFDGTETADTRFPRSGAATRFRAAFNSPSVATTTCAWNPDFAARAPPLSINLSRKRPIRTCGPR